MHTAEGLRLSSRQIRFDVMKCNNTRLAEECLILGPSICLRNICPGRFAVGMGKASDRTGVSYGIHSGSSHPHQTHGNPATSFWRIAKNNFKALNRRETKIKSI